MFTVLICDEKILADFFGNYHIYLEPLLSSEEIAFCAWNPEGKTLDDAVPQLRETVSLKKDWRAFLICDSSLWGFENADKMNPFDFVDSSHKINQNYRDMNSILANRKVRDDQIDRALQNPLTRLGIWLCGIPKNLQISSGVQEKLSGLNDSLTDTGYFRLLKQLDISAEEAEGYLTKEKRFQRLSKEFDARGELFNPPESIFTFAERSKDMESENTQKIWRQRTEFEYSRFYIDNLYPEQLRYILFDVPYRRGRMDQTVYFLFLVSLLVFAGNEIPQGTLRDERVYVLSNEPDENGMKASLQRYSAKMYATLARINSIHQRLQMQESEPIDDEEFQRAFEKREEIHISVDQMVHRDNLVANFGKLGLSTDCPVQESKVWTDQYDPISELFTRFLREPTRAVKKAVQGDFHQKNSISDERITRLNEYQREDLRIALDEEERSLIHTVPEDLFDTEKYKKGMQEAASSVSHEIRTRMTRLTTLISGICAAILFILGFITFLFDQENDVGSSLLHIAVIGVATGLLLVIGFAMLYSFRNRLKKCINEFNLKMTGMLDEIDRGVAAFATYLGHACNMMRLSSALNDVRNAYKQRRNILRFHMHEIEKSLNETRKLFSSFTDSEDIPVEIHEDPFLYDFTLDQEYEYSMSDVQNGATICFLQKGNEIFIPVDYLKAIRLTREELYD